MKYAIVRLFLILFLIFILVGYFIQTSINIKIVKCFETHGHIEMFEDGRVDCKYPLNIP